MVSNSIKNMKNKDKILKKLAKDSFKNFMSTPKNKKLIDSLAD